MNLQTFQAEVGEWSRRNFPNNLPHHPLLGVGEEVGELMHAHLKSDQGIRGTAEEHFLAKVDAVGDIMIYLADYCERNGISMLNAVNFAWSEVRERDWKKNQQDGKQ